MRFSLFEKHTEDELNQSKWIKLKIDIRLTKTYKILVKQAGMFELKLWVKCATKYTNHLEMFERKVKELYAKAIHQRDIDPIGFASRLLLLNSREATSQKLVWLCNLIDKKTSLTKFILWTSLKELFTGWLQ